MKYLQTKWEAGSLPELEIMQCLPLKELNECKVQIATASPDEYIRCVDSAGCPCVGLLLEGSLTQGNALSPIGNLRVRSSDVTNFEAGDFIGLVEIITGAESSALFRVTASVKLLLLRPTKFVAFVTKSPALAAAVFNSSSITSPLLREERQHELTQQFACLPGLEVVRTLSSFDWLQRKLQGLFSDYRPSDAEINLLAIRILPIGICDAGAIRIATLELAKILNNALRPSDVSAYYSEDTVLTVLPHTDQHSASVVKRRIEDRIARTVLFADMRRPLPHLQVRINIASSLDCANASRLIEVALDLERGISRTVS